MSNYHVKNISTDGRVASVVFHIPVPAGNNQASPTPIPWQTAVSEMIKPQNADGSFGTWSSSLQGIDAGELTSLRAGELLEVSESVRFYAEDTGIQKRDKMDARYNDLVTQKQSELGKELNYWGFSRNV